MLRTCGRQARLVQFAQAGLRVDVKAERAVLTGVTVIAWVTGALRFAIGDSTLAMSRAGVEGGAGLVDHTLRAITVITGGTCVATGTVVTDVAVALGDATGGCTDTMSETSQLVTDVVCRAVGRIGGVNVKAIGAAIATVAGRAFGADTARHTVVDNARAMGATCVGLANFVDDAGTFAVSVEPGDHSVRIAPRYSCETGAYHDTRRVIARSTHRRRAGRRATLLVPPTQTPAWFRW